MGVAYLWIIILSVVDDIPVDSEALLVTDFVNIKIKLSQSFECAHSNMVCVHVFIWEYSYVYEYLRQYVFLKKKGPRAVLQINIEKCGSALHILSHSLRKQ
jgi:hypothetical protein